MSRRTIDDLVEELRGAHARLEPVDAWAAQRDGALIVDTRSLDEQREQGCLIPGALHYPLSVAPWRLDPEAPGSAGALPLDTPIVVVCRHGYSSSIAAWLLREIGFTRATDVIGGVEAWVESGLPVEPVPPA